MNSRLRLRVRRWTKRDRNASTGIAIAVVAVLILAAACSSASSATSGERKAPSRPEEVYSYCFDLARAAGDDVERNGWGPSKEYTRFTSALDGLAGSLLPDSDISTSDWFQAKYQSMAAESPWQNSSARDAFQKAFDLCSKRYGANADVNQRIEPSPDVQQKGTCLAAGLRDVEERFGKGATSYTTSFNEYAHGHEDTDEPASYLETEEEYHDSTGNSPFVDEEAARALREASALC